MSAEVLEGFRLSPQQRAAWRDASAGRLPAARCAILIEGPIDEALLGRAIDDAWKRYEVLRTFFPTLPGMSEPLQVIADPGPVSVRRTEDAGTFGTFLDERAAMESRARGLQFDSSISEGPVSAVELFAISASRRVLLVALPAVCADARSLELLARDIAQLYGGAAFAQESSPAPLQYADIAQWLNDLLEGDMSGAGAAYWKPFLADATPRLELPFDLAGNRRVTPRLESHGFVLPPALSRELGALAARSECPPSAVVLAALCAVLSRYADRSDFLLARGSDGRRLEELQSALGPLYRWLPLRCEIGEAETFDALARQLGRQLADQEVWQEYLPAPSDSGAFAGSASPWSPIAFEYREAPEPVHVNGAAFSVRAVELESPGFPLRFACTRDSDSVSVSVHYDSNRFGASDIEGLAESFETLLAEAIRSPQTPVARLLMASPASAARLLAATGGTRSAARVLEPLYRQFERQARERPGATALVGEGRELSFREADALANRVARKLAALGVTANSVVGILLERSVASVVALLAVWKAGGAYLPIEVSTPAERRNFMLQDSGARVVLTTRAIAASSSDWPCALFAIEDADGGEPVESGPPAALTDAPDSLAYIIYTSGSTVQPMGVAVEHRQLASYVGAIVNQLRPPLGARFATVSTFAADLGHTAIFPPLVTGGTLHVIPQELARDADALADEFSRRRIDYLKIVPSHLSALLAGSRPAAVIPARALILGGEALTWELVAQVRGLAPACEIINHYGPTETTVGATTRPLPPGAERIPGSKSVPIGRPIAGARAYVLDRFLSVLPVWAPGELYIAGEGVARGYQNRPELTAERFVDDPFHPGSRMYRTGDVARWLPGGEIEWLGRADYQVKVRGFRVELGEIEARLREHPGVLESVVLLREDSPGEKRLVAYFVPPAGASTGEPEMQEFLRGSLPEFMVPASFVSLKKLPLTANGKIDRRALPAPDPSRPSRGPGTAPRNPIEQELATIWQQVLRLETVGVDDNFFHLGGDSILAIQIVARANRAGLRLTPRQLFQNQTVAELAGVVEKASGPGAEESSAAGAVPLTPIQTWFFEQDLTDVHHYNQAIFLEPPLSLDRRALEEAVAALLPHHDALRLRFRREGGEWRQELAASVPDRLFSSMSIGASDSALEEAATPVQSSLNIEKGPLARFVLFERAGSPGRLLIAVHHLAIDGVSWGILLEDLETAYGQRLRGASVTLPPRTTSFAGWARRLPAHASSGALDGESPYWLAAGRGAAPLPVDLPGPNGVESEAIVSTSLTAEETRALLQDVPAAYGTQINDALLTALLRAFGPWTGSDSLLVDLEGHGREEILEGANLSRTVGWFTSRFPVLLPADTGADLPDLLKQVKEQLRAVPQRGLGYGLLRYSGARPDVGRALAALPQPQVSFNYVGQVDSRYSEMSFFSRATGSAGRLKSPRQKRRYLLSLDGGIRNGRLEFSWTFSEAVHRRDTIDGLARSFGQVLRDVIAHCSAPDSGGYTPSDFPKAKLSQRGLEKLLSRISGEKQ